MGEDFDDGKVWIGKARAIVGMLDAPVAAWQVHRTAWEVYADCGVAEKAGKHRELARHLIMSIADSFDSGEPLRESFLSAQPVQRVLA